MRKHIALRLSFWAKSHRPASVAIIAVSKIAIGATGLYLGVWVALEGIILPVETKWLLAIIATFSILAYPSARWKRHWGRAAFYRRQKSMDGVLAGLGFVILFFAGNLLPAWVAQPQAGPVASQTLPVTYSVMKKPVEEYRTEVVRSGKIQRWVVAKAKARGKRVIDRVSRLSGNTDTGGKILLSFLLVLLAVAVAFLVAALSCSLACNGQEALATIVAILGLAGIIIGLVFGFKAIWDNTNRDRRHEKMRPPTGTGNE